MKLGQASSCVAIFALGLAFTANTAYSGPLEWRGFFTTGAAVTDSKVPYADGVDRKARLTDETFLGLNISKELNSEWRVAGQILGRSGQADGTAKVDWAFVTYEPTDSYHVVLGKQKVPTWMISEYIDVGRVYPWVVPPEEVYSLFPLKSFTGASAAYNWKFASSTLTFEPYGGDATYETSPSAPNAYSRRRGDNMVGASLQWNLGSTLLRAAYNQAKWDFDYGPELDFGDRRIEIYSFGLKSEWDGYLIMAEYAGLVDRDEDRYRNLARTLADTAPNAPAAEQASMLTRSALLSTRIGGAKSYYTTLGKEFLDDWLLHFTLASVKRPFQPNLSRDQTSFALGLNYDINTDSVIKVEGKRITLPGGSQGLFTQKPEHDEAMVYRLGYSLVF